METIATSAFQAFIRGDNAHLVIVDERSVTSRLPRVNVFPVMTYP
jgi:hypothetical protein